MNNLRGKFKESAASVSRLVTKTNLINKQTCVDTARIKSLLTKAPSLFEGSVGWHNWSKGGFKTSWEYLCCFMLNSRSTLLLFEVLTHCKQNSSRQCNKRPCDVIAGFKGTAHLVDTCQCTNKHDNTSTCDYILPLVMVIAFR